MYVKTVFELNSVLYENARRLLWIMNRTCEETEMGNKAEEN